MTPDNSPILMQLVEAVKKCFARCVEDSGKSLGRWGYVEAEKMEERKEDGFCSLPAGRLLWHGQNVYLARF